MTLYPACCRISSLLSLMSVSWSHTVLCKCSQSLLQPLLMAKAPWPYRPTSLPTQPEIKGNFCIQWPPAEMTWVQKGQSFKNSLKFTGFAFWEKTDIFLVRVSYFIAVSNLERNWQYWNFGNLPIYFFLILNLFLFKFPKQKFEESSP